MIAAEDHRTALDTWLRDGRTPKEYAVEHGISISWTYRLVWDIGFKSVYVSEAERRLLLSLRKEQIQ